MNRTTDDLNRIHEGTVGLSGAAVLPLESKPATPHGMARTSGGMRSTHRHCGTLHASRLASAVARARTKAPTRAKIAISGL